METRDALTLRLEAKIHAEIPLSRHMGFQVRKVHGEGATCFLPLAPNTNHLGTQFGGSLFAAGALSCYIALLGLLARLGLESGNIVITNGNIEYLAPGTGDVLLNARLPNEGRVDFEAQLHKKNRARIKIETEIVLHNDIVAKVFGEYLVRRESKT
ncbi:MAG: YiiD C-terminal domain-containing protein [Bdellovibrionota bacterium]